MNYDVIVIGGGHAGIEACLATSRMGLKTLLVTMDFSRVGFMPCNPSIGGPAKGIVVREIDALGGEMGRCADATLIQMKMLNVAKGPAVQSLRAQIDRVEYPKYMQNVLKNQDNLDIIENKVKEIDEENNKVVGITLENNEAISAKCVIVTTGTYMQSDVLIGENRIREGADNSESSDLSECLRNLNIDTFRLKTGTPPRISKSSIDFSKVEIQNGDKEIRSFSFYRKATYDVDKQVPCFLTYTTLETQKIIEDNLEKSSMYGARKDISSVGPRYCPSIEDKIVRFSDKNRHQIFLEPESIHYDDIYIQGFSSSMPSDVQHLMVESIIGLENAKINKYAYAIEYDAINPLQLRKTLELKSIDNLFFAGQVNGTSGYEEAAAQGIVAGINAALKIKNKEPLVLKRSDCYIGVMIDDLVTKGTQEPYRLLTSRAEFRLLLRSDNADLRLSEFGYNCGLLSREDYDIFAEKKARIEGLIERLSEYKINPNNEVNDYLESIGSSKLTTAVFAKDIFRRPEIKFVNVRDLTSIDEIDTIYKQAEIELKYEGYISKAWREVAKMEKLEKISLDDDIDYRKIKNLSLEAIEKLEKVRPTTVGQASRISGVNPADISILLIERKKK